MVLHMTTMLLMMVLFYQLLHAIIILLIIVHIDSRHGPMPLMEVVVDLVSGCHKWGMQQSVASLFDRFYQCQVAVHLAATRVAPLGARIVAAVTAASAPGAASPARAATATPR